MFIWSKIPKLKKGILSFMARSSSPPMFQFFCDQSEIFYTHTTNMYKHFFPFNQPVVYHRHCLYLACFFPLLTYLFNHFTLIDKELPLFFNGLIFYCIMQQDLFSLSLVTLLLGFATSNKAEMNSFLPILFHTFE